MTIKTKVMSALRWTALARFSAQIISWGITIFVIRILNPEDYGLMSIATVFTGLAMLINELGLIPALIQKKNIDDYLIRQVYGVLILSNITFFVVIIIGAPLLGYLFDETRLISVVRVLSLTLLIGAFIAVPRALLQRDIQFKGLSVVEFFSMLASSVVTLLLALSHAGVWSLVGGQVALQIVTMVGVLYVSRFRLMPVFNFVGLGGVFSFGAKVTLSRVLWYANCHIDIVLVGKLLGSQLLGVYSVAFNLATLPMNKIISLVNQVAFPAYSRLQADIGLAGTYYFAGTRLASFIFFPMMWGLSSVSEEFVTVLLGDKWLDAILVLKVISLVIPFRVLSMLLGPFLNGLGHPGVNVRNLFTFTVLLPVAILVGVRWGLLGVSIMFSVASFIGVVINFNRTLPMLQTDWKAFLTSIWPSLLSSIIMYIVVHTLKYSLLFDVELSTRLVLLILVGASTYISFSFLLNRKLVFQSIDLLRSAT